MSREELLSPGADPIERAEETTLRPRRLDEFVGQERLKEHLEILLEAARRRQQPVDHLLFAGPPGLGKTTMAGIVAAELGVSLRVTSGPAIEKPGDLVGIVTNLAECEDGVERGRDLVLIVPTDDDHVDACHVPLRTPRAGAAAGRAR